MKERSVPADYGGCTRVVTEPGSSAQRSAKKVTLLHLHEPLAVGRRIAGFAFAFMGAFGWVHGDVPVDVPSAFHATRQPKAVREDAVEISLARDGRVLFRHTRVLPKSLPILIRGAVQDGAEKKVYLAVDARAKYGDAAAVVDAIARAGINQICFLAYKRER